MKNIALFVLLAVATILGCKQDKSSTTASVAKTENLAKEKHGYAYNNLKTKVEWTAFKFTSKAPVGGEIKSFKVKTSPLAKTIEGLVQGTEFELDAASIDSKNEVRDGRILQYFFGALTSGSIITGKINSVKDGKANTTIAFNGKSKDIDLNYEVNTGVVTLTGKIDVADWDGLGAINALNKVCHDLHKGPDGKSKLWSEVDLKITTRVDKK